MQLHTKNPNPTLGRDLLIFITLLFVHSLVFVSTHHFIGDIVASVSIIPVTILAWLQGKKLGILAVIIVYLLNLILAFILTHQPWSLLFNLSNLIGTGVILTVALFVGHIHTLSRQLHLEIAKRKQLQDLLETQNANYDKLLTQNSQFKRRQQADFSAQIASVKSELESLTS